MSNFYLYVKRKKDTLEVSHCEKIEVKNVIKMDKIFNFNVFFHFIERKNLKQFCCTEVQTGINFCISQDSLEDCINQFEDMKMSAKLKDIALAMGKAKSIVQNWKD